ncbi:hypothetical protein OG539_32615 [Actinacidiphila glaucinigra]
MTWWLWVIACWGAFCLAVIALGWLAGPTPERPTPPTRKETQ